MKSTHVLGSCLSALALVSAASAQSNYTYEAESALETLQKWYNKKNGLWNTCGWWNGANCMTVIADLAAVDNHVLATATSVFANTYTAAPGSNPHKAVKKRMVEGHPETTYDYFGPGSSMTKKKITGLDYCDTCYDDDGWWALAWIAAYDVTKEENYLTLAEEIFTVVNSSKTTNCHGGVYWCDNSNYVNAIANELYMSMAAHIANRVAPNLKEQYLTIAQKQWEWFESSGMINPNNTINDGLTTSCTNNGQTVWSYNQGVILGGLVELNKATGNDTLLDKATVLATAAIQHLADSNMILHDSCEPNCAPDATQFKGIFIRNLYALHKAKPSDLFQQVILANAKSVYANDKEAANNAFSINWAGPPVNGANASTHSSGMEPLIAAIGITGS